MTDSKQARTINTAYAEIVKDDPNTAISRNAIRQAVLKGEIPCRKVGRTYVIAKEDVLDYFTGHSTGEEGEGHD